MAQEARTKRYWLVKQEPSAYSWADFVADGKTSWTGVRNYTARNNLREMKAGDQVLYYHSVTDKAVFGVAEVSRTAYPDPTVEEGDWSAVELTARKPLQRPVALDEIKTNPRLKEMALLRLSRLSATGHGEGIRRDRPPGRELGADALRLFVSRGNPTTPA